MLGFVQLWSHAERLALAAPDSHDALAPGEAYVPLVLGVTLVLGLALLWWNLWRTWLFIAPGSVKFIIEDPGPVSEVPGVIEPLHDALVGLGFVSLGTHLETPRFGHRVLVHDYANARTGVFASLHPTPPPRARRFGKTAPWAPSDGPRAWLTLTTPAANGVVISANYRRPGANQAGRFLCGAIEGVPPERLLKAHLRRVAELGSPTGEWTLESALRVAETVPGEFGKTEVRQQHAVALLWTLGGLGMVGASIVGLTGLLT